MFSAGLFTPAAEGSQKMGQRKAWFISPHIGSRACAESVAIGCLIHWCRRALALLDVPKCTRAAISLRGSVVSWRNRAAIASLPASLLRRAASSPCCQPSRSSSWAKMRSAFASAVSRCSSPEWWSPSLPWLFAVFAGMGGSNFPYGPLTPP